MSKPADTAAKKPEGAPAQSAPKADPQPQSKGKGHNPGPDGCHSWGCKAQAKRFNFCNEHYDHFKFGLIKKSGERVPDFEKKYEHFMAHQQGSKTPLRKVA